MTIVPWLSAWDIMLTTYITSIVMHGATVILGTTVRTCGIPLA